MDKKTAIRLIEKIQGGRGTADLKDKAIPIECRGSIVKDKWNDSVFTIGIEYGIMTGLILAFDIKYDEEKGWY